MKIRFKKLAPDVILPSYAHPGDAGMDLYARETRTLENGEPHIFKLGLAAEIPEGHVIFFKDRSGMGAKGMTLLGGVIDSTYRGEWGVILLNTTHKEFLIKPGDRIAQAVLLPVPSVEIEEVEELSETKRGDGGFGSTGR